MMGKEILKKQATSSDGELKQLFIDDADAVELPIKSIEDLTAFEKSLNNKEFKISYIKKLSLIGSVHSKMLAIRVIDSLLSKKVLKNVCWKGTKDKLAMYSNFKNILDLIIKVVKLRYPSEDAGTICENVMRHKFKNSKTENVQKKDKNTARCTTFKTTSPSSLKKKKQITESQINYFKRTNKQKNNLN